MKILLLLTLFVVGTSQQEPSLKCTQAAFYRVLLSVNVYSIEDIVKCTYANIKSLEDLDKARKTASGFHGNQKVTVLVFTNSSLSKLLNEMFEGYSNTRSLEGRRMELEEISKTAFSNLKSWDEIDLSFNQIRRLEEWTFSSMLITHLDLSQNLIESIDDTTFSDAQIKELKLAFNKIKSLQFLGTFKMFLTVEMNDNLIDTFNLQVKKDVFQVLARDYPNDLIPNLLLQNNRFTTFECSFKIKITSIALQKNPTLTSVSLNECELNTIDVSDCENLRKVSLNDNLTGFTAKNVNLNDGNISQAKSLTTLSLANSSVSPGVLENILKMEKLTSLDLSYIPIGPLNASTFAKLKSLEFLVLKATNISNIQSDTFSHQRSVKTLDISENHLRYFDMSMISSMNNSLSSLNLAGNDLTSLENYESAHSTFTKLHEVDLTNNKFPCDYLMRLMKVFELNEIELTRNYIEEETTQIDGVECVQEMRKKLNILIEKTDSN